MKFNKYLTSIVVSVLTFALVVSLMAQVVKAEEIIKEQEEQEIQEFAEQLKFVWEEASIKNESGKIIGFDIEKMENTYGQSEDPEALEAIVNFKMKRHQMKTLITPRTV